MDLKQLEYFVRVAELGSFTRASGVLDIAQPALSRQVRLLEVELRQNLLLRNGRGVTTTEAGKLLLEHGRGILHQLERAREDLGRVRGALAGRVAVGLPPSIAKIMTVPLTRAFRKRLPSAALSISEGLSMSMQESLLTGRLDIALLYNPTPSPQLETVPLLDEDLYLVSPRSGKARVTAMTLKEVAALPLVIPSRPNAIRMVVETQMASIGCKPVISLEIDGIAAILDLVADGEGHAILPRYAVSTSAQPKLFQVRAITRPKLGSKLALATASGRTTTLTQQAMLQLIREVAMATFGSVAVAR
ncbi:MAG: LysR family transcriptional regulator [Burkholderiales bacterium]|nr:LysR family transcriptional regulator [Burkholderiales bacterium]